MIAIIYFRPVHTLIKLALISIFYLMFQSFYLSCYHASIVLHIGLRSRKTSKS
jgi:hypothetical protein